MSDLESAIAEWRTFVGSGPAVEVHDVDELEDHLRVQIADLTASGLTADEAFLIAVKRMGATDELSREFAREHSGRLWRQLFSPFGDQEETGAGWPAALGFAIGAAAAVGIALLAAGYPDEQPTWLMRNASLFVLPFMAGFLARRRELKLRGLLLTAIPFAVAALLINLYPYENRSSTEWLVAMHLPVVLWLVCSYPYSRGDLRSHEMRMDFVRFTGEWFIYYVLIALGGGVLMALTGLILEPTGADVERVIAWVLPAGAAGAVVVAAWLVESKQRVVENMAPVLTMIFTPLFALMLLGTAIVYAVTQVGGSFDRELLGVLDALLVVVLGLVLYGMSARDSAAAPGWMDRIQLVVVASALALDALVVGTMITRIGQLGLTPNRTAALGLNIVLLVNLLGTAWLSARFVGGRSTFRRVERWQITYLPLFALWAGAVVVAFPPLFGFS